MKAKEIGKDLLILSSLIINSLTYFFSGLFTRKEKQIVFGAWGGNKYSDNPRYLLEALKEDQNLELYWVGKPFLKDLPIFQQRNVHFLRRGSLRAYLQILCSKNVYFSNSYRDLGYINLLKGATVTQLWHGFGLKNTLSAKKNTSSIKKLYYRIGSRTYEKYDYFISSSGYNTKKILQSFHHNGITKENIIPCGQPKNEFLLQASRKGTDQEIIEGFRKRYKIPENKKIITYLPTFRDHDRTFQFNTLKPQQKQRLIKMLTEHNAVIFEKMHFADAIPYQKEGVQESTIISIDPLEDSQELLMATDILISDYSSCYLDFTLLDRPIIHFAYDLEAYEGKDRGLFYSLEKFAAGKIIKDFDELLNFTKELLRGGDPDSGQRKMVREQLMGYEEGKSSAMIKGVTITGEKTY